MAKYTVEVVYYIEDIDAESADEAEVLADGAFKSFVRHPQTGEVITAQMYTHAEDDEASK